jgi:hydroxymethylpyrimidine/phosphomethylpyrimidine kinase
MKSLQRLPIALTIAGSDSGGGAGIQADLKTFAAYGVHGCSAITCLTAQNPRGVRAIQATASRMVIDQVAAVFAELPPKAVKTGMLYSAEIIGAVAKFFSQAHRPPLVVDPVMVATSGAPLLRPAAMEKLKRELLPIASLVTPNLHEAQILLNRPIRSLSELKSAAEEIVSKCGCPALVKGGHLTALEQATDVFFDGRNWLVLKAPFVRGVDTHGTGCTYSAAITAGLAQGHTLPQSVRLAKRFITRAIGSSQRIARHTALNWLRKV